ncbi:LysR substrate-binding domain-containing protein [Jannaschia rubra]|uniref:HTH-type transcriptional activator CmpR n=1 Tax=Jannaschia rubra TaxID=282197 RepID=A0A0M6XNT3_9RHOB|nr:LysR substrate-binding domain-containing protein [Jannaschia rubra]CTQ32749.1 HTH-type transcriptional activator CmpR [Jannaschia rubra]SFF88799.1 transcriptional regulator, LysR family [Jannaschia rubra]
MNRADAADDGGDRRSGITLRELEVLHALIRTGTAMNAARSLGISQSAVSRRLAQLEDRLGLALFTRAGGRLVATPEAFAINEQLGPVFATLGRIVNHAREPRTAHRGTLSIVAPPTIAHRFLPGRIAAFRKRNPELHISLEVIASDSLITGIAECRFDVGLTDTQPAHDGITSEPLIATQAICILPGAHHLADRDVIRPEHLEGEAFVALSRRHSSRVAIDRTFERAGVRRHIAIETATSVSAMEFVRDGLGVSLVNPFPIVHQIGRGVAVRPFLPEIAYTTSFLLPSSRAPTAAAVDFIAATRASLDRTAYPTAP